MKHQSSASESWPHQREPTCLPWIRNYFHVPQDNLNWTTNQCIHICISLMGSHGLLQRSQCPHCQCQKHLEDHTTGFATILFHLLCSPFVVLWSTTYVYSFWCNLSLLSLKVTCYFWVSYLTFSQSNILLSARHVQILSVAVNYHTWAFI